ncbi:MAG TPA: HAD family hydrolase [Candidatus Nanoarchaeia archaeon]|nr:HAD family hydrolase [Candidatus Nanoarchaeia archaeon]
MKSAEDKKNQIKAVIFDYDGVLVDSREIGLASYKAIAEHFGAVAYSSMKEFQEAQNGRYKNVLVQWGATTPEQIEHAENIYKQVHKSKNVNPIPGIKEVLEGLSKDYILALVSGTYKKIINVGLKKNNLEHYFHHIIGKDDVQNIKPAPDGLLMSLKRLGIKPHEAIYIGDMVIDIMMGRSAGVKTAIMTSHSWNTVEDLKKGNPDILIERPEQILQVLHG